jgi:hypothetical protein
MRADCQSLNEQPARPPRFIAESQTSAQSKLLVREVSL